MILLHATGTCLVPCEHQNNAGRHHLGPEFAPVARRLLLTLAVLFLLRSNLGVHLAPLLLLPNKAPTKMPCSVI